MFKWFSDYTFFSTEERTGIMEYQYYMLVLTIVTISSVTAEYDDYNITLVNGDSTHEGRVEVLYEGEWGTVCDDGWDLNDAIVVCKQMGFPGAIEAVQGSWWKSGGPFGAGSGKIWFTNVRCHGTEPNIWECKKKEEGFFNWCLHWEDAGVRCIAEGEPTPSPCAMNCSNNGTCYNNQCICQDGWQGDRCESREPCYINPCHNNGTCKPNNDTFICYCPIGYNGTRCDQELTTMVPKSTTSSILITATTTHADSTRYESSPKQIYSTECVTLSINGTNEKQESNSQAGPIIGVIVAIMIVVVVILIGGYIIYRKKRKKVQQNREPNIPLGNLTFGADDVDRGKTNHSTEEVYYSTISDNITNTENAHNEVYSSRKNIIHHENIKREKTNVDAGEGFVDNVAYETSNTSAELPVKGIANIPSQSRHGLEGVVCGATSETDPDNERQAQELSAENTIEGFVENRIYESGTTTDQCQEGIVENSIYISREPDRILTGSPDRNEIMNTIEDVNASDAYTNLQITPMDHTIYTSLQ